MNKILKMSTFSADGECSRDDINQLISALVRVGYEVYLNNDYICFKMGNDDILEDSDEK